jgi:hypothetical protein
MARVHDVHVLLFAAGLGLAVVGCGGPAPTVRPVAPAGPTTVVLTATVTATEPITTTGVVTSTLAGDAETATAAAGLPTRAATRPPGALRRATVVPKAVTRVLGAFTAEATVAPTSPQPGSDRDREKERDRDRHATQLPAAPSDTPCDCPTMPPRRASATIPPADTAPPPPTSPPEATAEPSAAPPALSALDP